MPGASGTDAGLTRRELPIGGGGLALAAAIAAALEHGRLIVTVERSATRLPQRPPTNGVWPAAVREISQRVPIGANYSQA
jgi:hypothetical protein